MRICSGVVSVNYSSDAFGALTEDRSVASLPFGGRYRLIDFPLSNMVNSGIYSVGLIAPHNFRSLLDHVGVGKEWDLSRKVGGVFIMPGTVYGAKKPDGKFLLNDYVTNRAFFDRSHADCVVFTATSKLFNIDFRDVVDAHDASGADVTMVYKKDIGPTEPCEEYLEMTRSGKVVGINNTPDHGDNAFVDAMVIDMRIVKRIMEWYAAMPHLDLVDIIAHDLDMLKVMGYEFDGYVSSIGGVKSYMRCNMELLKPDVRAKLFNEDRPIETKVQDNPPAIYTQDAEVKNSIVATGSRIAGKVENSVIFRGVSIEKGAEVKNCVILQNCTIEKKAHVENAVFDKFAAAGKGVNIIGRKNNPIVVRKGTKL